MGRILGAVLVAGVVLAATAAPASAKSKKLGLNVVHVSKTVPIPAGADTRAEVECPTGAVVDVGFVFADAADVIDPGPLRAGRGWGATIRSTISREATVIASCLKGAGGLRVKHLGTTTRTGSSADATGDRRAAGDDDPTVEVRRLLSGGWRFDANERRTITVQCPNGFTFEGMEQLPSDVNENFTVHAQTPLSNGRGISIDVQAHPYLPGSFTTFIVCKRGRGGIRVLFGRQAETREPTLFVNWASSSQTTLAALANATIDALCGRGGIATGGTTYSTPAATGTSLARAAGVPSGIATLFVYDGLFINNGRGWQAAVKSVANEPLIAGAKAFCLSGSKLKVKSS